MILPLGKGQPVDVPVVTSLWGEMELRSPAFVVDGRGGIVLGGGANCSAALTAQSAMTMATSMAPT